MTTAGDRAVDMVGDRKGWSVGDRAGSTVGDRAGANRARECSSAAPDPRSTEPLRDGGSAEGARALSREEARAPSGEETRDPSREVVGRVARSPSSRCLIRETINPCASPGARFSFIKSFSRCQFPHKSVNLFFILVMIKEKLTDLWGN